MSFNPTLESKFKGMFSHDRINKKLRKFQETGSAKALDNSDDESDKKVDPPSKEQPEVKTQSTPQTPDDSSTKLSDQTAEGNKPQADPDTHRSSDEGRNRYIQRWWPRDPHGPKYEYGWPGGKMTSNGNPQWGATLLDFFGTNRVPTIDNFVLYSSGSRLAAFTRRLGEKECAWSEAELAWADAEEDPKQLFPVDTGLMIKGADTRVHFGIRRSMPKHSENTSDAELDSENPFKSQNYPDPWPVVPFTAPNATLESRLPLHLLPEKLVVHDPQGTLHASSNAKYNTEARWESFPDFARKYHLSLSTEGRAKRKQSKEDALKEWVDKCEKVDTMVFEAGHDRDENGLVDAPVLVELPSPPRPITEIPEAHVYFSPAKYIGSGNHSFVYDVEWELPRSAFFKPQLCRTCIASAVENIVRERYKDSAPPRGTLVSEVKMVKPGVTVELVTKEEIDSKIPGGRNPSTGLSEFPENIQPPEVPRNPARMQRISEPVYQKLDIYEGESIRIKRDEIDIQYQHPYTGLGPCCEHLRPTHPHPLTATVRVTAKISRKYDEHLEREARNYQSFPSHFFEHWNGFNLINPLHDPVPVGAVVPQFYGYYKPDDKAVTEFDKNKYLSPILLLENCGEQVTADELSRDDRNECASLFYRFHSAGWLHQSVYERNVLVKKGSLFEWPIQRSSQDRRFRLIDFGRSSKIEIPEAWKKEKFFHRMTGIGNSPSNSDVKTRMQEEMDIARCFKVHIY
ncbi:hypothetical protein QCA50_006252 [Cerrena zonata]|uniref:Protein kinase domain-containing protein n=1 Tax=Cerrena zonata TaxID=2478898 RepID=A0AAW0GNH7_9APHY